VVAPPRRTARRPLDVVLGLLGVAGIAAGITLLALDGRALMNIGGFCAEGGPYEIAVHCPHNSEVIFLLGFLGGGAAIVLAEWKSSAIGLGPGTVLLLAFTAVFGVIGLETLLAGFDPPGDEPGWAWGWLIMGTMFVAAAAVPLLLMALSFRVPVPAAGAAGGTRSRETRAGGGAEWPTTTTTDAAPPATDAGGGAARPGSDDVSRDIAAGAEAVARSEGAAPGGPGVGLVEGLERLADLRDKGSLTDAEYARAKDELLGRGEGRDAGDAAAGSDAARSKGR
jgi:Short C-terminal domain